MGSRAVILWWLLAAWASGCSFLIEVDEVQCERDLDCTAAGIGDQCIDGLCVAAEGDDSSSDDGDSAGDRDAGMTADAAPTRLECGDATCEADELCLDDSCVPEDDAEPWLCEPDAGDDGPTGMVSYRVHVQEFVSEQPPVNLRVRACRTNDIDCEDALATFEAEPSDDTGDVELELPAGFMGFLELEGDDMLPTLYAFTRPVLSDVTAKDLLVVAPSTLTVLATFTGFEVDDSRGLVILETFACNGVSAGGIHFAESKQSSIPFYIVNELPNAEVTATVRDDANDIAIGGFLNVEPGFSTFSAMLGEAGPVVSEWNAQVRANTVTYVDLHP